MAGTIQHAGWWQTAKHRAGVDNSLAKTEKWLVYLDVWRMNQDGTQKVWRWDVWILKFATETQEDKLRKEKKKLQQDSAKVFRTPHGSFTSRVEELKIHIN